MRRREFIAELVDEATDHRQESATICPISQGAAYPRIAAVPINPCVGEARAQHNCRPATLRQLTMYRLCSPAIEAGISLRASSRRLMP